MGKPFKTQKNLTMGGKVEDSCTEHDAPSKMMGSAGTKFFGELSGSLSYPGSSPGRTFDFLNMSVG